MGNPHQNEIIFPQPVSNLDVWLFCMNSYIPAHNVLAVVLVGGEGSRLGPLTLYRTKPAVMTGPAILASFSTSAALNSGIDKVMMASQYLTFSLE
jgi:hypothetical protein